MKSIHTIDDVIETLDGIVQQSQTDNDPLGYFAVLYQKVTVKVKEGIAGKFFDDNPRMERLDVIFASRYIDAYVAYKNNQPVTESWQRAFDLSVKYWPIVLQHLLIGMNAHINLDLGIAAAEVSKGKDIRNLEGDFNKINEILSSLVHDVENDLAEIWPRLKTILRWTGKFDNFLVDFSMKLAREGAWKFALEVAKTSQDILPELIEARDQKVARKAKIVSNPGWIISILFKIIRLGERGTVAEKIEDLKK